MNRSQKLLIGVTSVFLGLALGGAAFAGGPWGCHGGRGGAAAAHIIDELDLTDEQEEVALKIRDDMRERQDAMRKDNHAAADELIAELKKAQPDNKRIHSIIDERISAFTRLIHYGVDRILQLHATLSDDQRAEATEKIQKFHDRARRWSE